MSNTISYRIYDFLKDHPPFSFVEKDDLLNISEKVSVLYLEKGSVLFRQGDEPPRYFYVVREGAVQLYNEYKNENILIDVCDEGDIFGIRPLVSVDQPYTLTSVIAEEALIYKIPVPAISTLRQDNKNIENFFASSFAGGVRNPYSNFSRHKVYHHHL